MNQIILNLQDYNESSATATCHDQYIIEHVNRTLKFKGGEEVRVCVPTIGVGTALVRLDTDGLSFEEIKLSPGKQPWCRLAIGLSRPATCKKIIEHATTMGVNEFVFFNTELSEKSYSTSKIWDEKNLEKLLKLGLSQSRDYFHIPKVTLIKSVHQMTEVEGKKIILSLEAEKWMPGVLDRNDDFVTFAIGPERGWTKKEETLFLEKGFLPAKISQSVLRVENAVISALGQAELIFNS